jgi:hypothetical protein
MSLLSNVPAFTKLNVNKTTPAGLDQQELFFYVTIPNNVLLT